MQSSVWTSTRRTVAPASSAARTHGVTFASWSSTVTTTSSPGRSVRANDRDRWNAIVVVFCPITTSCGVAPRNAAAAACASSTTWSDRRLVSNAPPRFAFQFAR